MTTTTVVHVNGIGNSLHDYPEFKTPDGRVITGNSNPSDPKPYEDVVEEFVCDGRVVARHTRIRQDWFFACETPNGFQVLRGDQVPPDAIHYGAAQTFGEAESVFMSDNFGE